MQPTIIESIWWNQYSRINIVELKLNNYLFIKVFQQNFVLAEYQNFGARADSVGRTE